jgi:hypothetical protein
MTIKGLGFRLALLLPATVLAITAAPAASEELAWGTTATSVYTVAFSGFVPLNAFTVNNMGVSSEGSGTVCNDFSGGTCYFSASVSLPSGAKIVGLDLEACDATALGSVKMTLASCPVNTNSCSTVATVTSGGGCATRSSGALSTTVDNGGFYYVLISEITDTTVGVAGRAARLRYQLQVSPAPSTATFLDVPVTHTYFRAIEALAASGITQGCGSGNYCPNGTVTRAEMAAFFARALGLHFPN